MTPEQDFSDISVTHLLNVPKLIGMHAQFAETEHAHCEMCHEGLIVTAMAPWSQLKMTIDSVNALTAKHQLPQCETKKW